LYFILFWHNNCNVNTQAYICLNLISFLICFPLLHFLFLFFYSITFFHFIFVLCRRLQCGHSCQCFVSTLISFLIHFPLLHFLFIFFYSITLFYITFVAVLTTAMSTLMPIFCLNFILFYFLFCFVLFCFIPILYTVAKSTLMPKFFLHSWVCRAHNCNADTHAIIFVLLLTVAMWWKAERVQIHATSDWFGLFCTVVTLSASGLTSVRRLPVESWKSTKIHATSDCSGMFYRLYSWPTNQGSGSRRHRQNQCQKLVSYPIRSLKKVPHTTTTAVIQPHHYIWDVIHV